MDKVLAENLMKAISLMNDEMSNVADQIELITDEKEKIELKLVIGKLIAWSFTELMMPIIKQYPEFDPDGDRYRKKNKKPEPTQQAENPDKQ